MPRQVSQMIKLLSDVQKNMKNMKKSLDDMKNKVSSVETVELQPELPERETPPVGKLMTVVQISAANSMTTIR